MRKDRRCLYITAYLKCVLSGICQPDCCCTSQGTGAEFRTNYSRLFKQTETDMVSLEEGFCLAHLLYLWFPKHHLFFLTTALSSCLITTKKHQIGRKIIGLLKWTILQVLRFYYCYPASSRILVLGQLSDAVNCSFGLCQVGARVVDAESITNPSCTCHKVNREVGVGDINLQTPFGLSQVHSLQPSPLI